MTDKTKQNKALLRKLESYLDNVTPADLFAELEGRYASGTPLADIFEGILSTDLHQTQIVYVDMDDTLCDFRGAYHREVARNPGIQFPQSQYRFFANLEPIEGAVDAVKRLIESERYEPYILTAPSIPNPLSYAEKREWIEDKFGYEFCERLIISPNKALLRGAVLIDDNHEGKGQEGFKGELLHFGSDRFPDWHSILKHLGL